MKYIVTIVFAMIVLMLAFPIHGNTPGVSPLDGWNGMVVREFGAMEDAQVGDLHRGVTLVSMQEEGQAPPLLRAIDLGRVLYVGPLYCTHARACRGNHAIVLKLASGEIVAYSYGSVALVKAGDVVEAGAAIGRIGQEGYAASPQLFLQVYRGEWSGNPMDPFVNGVFVNPCTMIDCR